MEMNELRKKERKVEGSKGREVSGVVEFLAEEVWLERGKRRKGEERRRGAREKNCTLNPRIRIQQEEEESTGEIGEWN